MSESEWGQARTGPCPICEETMRLYRTYDGKPPICHRCHKRRPLFRAATYHDWRMMLAVAAYEGMTEASRDRFK